MLPAIIQSKNTRHDVNEPRIRFITHYSGKAVSHVLILIFLFASTSVLQAQQHHMHDDHPLPDGAEIGYIDFNINCNDEVIEDFNHALGMMHHMMYVSSRETYEKIIEADPGCAMAHWGVATTLFQPLWGTRPSADDLHRGWDHISKAMNLVESERERLLVESTAEFFREPDSADFRTRIQRWADAMEAAYDSYSDDLDIASLYSLSRLTLAQYSEDRAAYFDEAEAILRTVFEEQPLHPGAIHYTIHATDVDGRAMNALDVVEAYGEIAPEVPHALHMPSHIYVRLGDWPEVIDWNTRSADAALNHPVSGAESHHYIHAIDYLVYAYLQRGEDEKAEHVFQEALQKERHQGSFVSAFHFAAIPARLAVEQRDWEKAAALEPRTPGYLPWDDSPWAEGLTWYAKGLGAVYTGDLNSAREAEERLAELRDVAESRGDDNMVVYIETDRLVLAGRIAFEDGNEEEALDLLQSAAELELTAEKHPVTPGALQPPREALGYLLLDLNRPADALSAFESSDNLWPGRLNTLMGASIAAKLSGNDRLARDYFANLLNSATGLDYSAMDDFHSAVEH
jgi:tetratricopeptide (TPR) repeat protein